MLSPWGRRSHLAGSVSFETNSIRPLMRQDQSSLPPVIQAMLEPRLYLHPVADVELRQTHTSYVLLAGDFVYKIRKPVRFAFIDCSTVARRFALCHRELELNRRLSPDVYLAVVAIRQRGEQVSLEADVNDAGDALEFAVKMRRLPENRRLDLMIERDEAGADNIRSIAKTVGSFHASAPNTYSWAYGAAASIWRMTVGNLVEIEQLAPAAPLQHKIALVEAYTRRYIAAHWEILNSRARDGLVREGHGDLRADAVYLTSNGIRIIDCLEFDQRLRYTDIANEVAFLAMDIERLGRPDLSRELSACFLHDRDVAFLLRFYKSYRAMVRVKVELLRSRQQDCPPEDQQTALDNARHLLDLALGFTEAPRALLIVCGASGTGKSTLATKVREHFDFSLFSSDLVRKQLAGIDTKKSAAAPYNRGIYTPEFTRRVYVSLLEQAKSVLNNGKGVILDATFSKRSQRQMAIEVANEAGVDPLFIECRADKEVILRRLVEREQDSQRASDATVEIYLAQRDEFEPLDELPPSCHLPVDTTNDLTASIIEVERRVYSSAYSMGAGRNKEADTRA
jgi:aminoglycoside phosphotransferase family enzyme/predicted kinase